MIFCQKVDYQIAFMLDKETTHKIADWDESTPYSKVERELLFGAADGTPSFHINFAPFAADRIFLTVTKTFGYKFHQLFELQKSSSLVYLKSDRCPIVITEPCEITLKIEGLPHQELTDWEYWISSKAFTGQYSYSFYENSTFDVSDIHIRDSSGRSIYLDNSNSLWDDM